MEKGEKVENGVKGENVPSPPTGTTDVPSVGESATGTTDVPSVGVSATGTTDVPSVGVFSRVLPCSKI